MNDKRRIGVCRPRTAPSIARLLAEISVDPDVRPTRDKPVIINDCCCGTGRILLEASTINPHAALLGQDIDARCVKITAINLGLRGRYGWAVCGNSLTGEMRFAYRIGSFFNETPNGLRRGVIRDVPPEETPAPMMAESARNDIADLFQTEAEDDAASVPTLPTLIEVPQWLAQLEPQLGASRRDRPPAVEERPERGQERTNDPPPKQRKLF